MKSNKIIAIFCSASNIIPDLYFKSAGQLGELLATNGFNLVYGGGNLGLMGMIARSFKQYNAYITGVIPKLIQERIEKFHNDELIITETMSQRKTIMIEKATGFIALPGGFGTLEEVLEVITLKQLGYFDKPIVFYNTASFYDELFHLFDKLFKENFAEPHHRDLYYISEDPDDILDYILNYKPSYH